MVHADYLFLMTDVDCLYDKNPRTNTDAKQIEVVEDITKLDVDGECLGPMLPMIFSLKSTVSTSGSKLGTGGMSTKIVAARLASSAGVTTVIARAAHPQNIIAIVAHVQNQRSISGHSASNSNSGMSTPGDTLSRWNESHMVSSPEISTQIDVVSNVAQEHGNIPSGSQSSSMLTRLLQHRLEVPLNSATELQSASSPPEPNRSASGNPDEDPVSAPNSSETTWNPHNLPIHQLKSAFTDYKYDPSIIPKHTRFIPFYPPIRDRYVWLLWGLAPHGTIYIDQGAHRALLKHAGLLPAGIVHVEGNFAQQEAVRIVVTTWKPRLVGEEHTKIASTDNTGNSAQMTSSSYESGTTGISTSVELSEMPATPPGVQRTHTMSHLPGNKIGGTEVGRALVNYSAVEVARIMGHRSHEIRGILGYADSEYVALRENLSLFNKEIKVASGPLAQQEQ